VTFDLVSRSGDELAFANMVQRCNNVGVGIYVDVVFNTESGTHIAHFYNEEAERGTDNCVVLVTSLGDVFRLKVHFSTHVQRVAKTVVVAVASLWPQSFDALGGCQRSQGLSEGPRVGR